MRRSVLALVLTWSPSLLIIGSATAWAQSVSFTEYPVPTAASTPEWITAGPDGALWFAEHSGHKIGRITTAGVFTEYPLPTGASYVSGITAGPDGALWYTASNFRTPDIPPRALGNSAYLRT